MQQIIRKHLVRTTTTPVRVQHKEIMISEHVIGTSMYIYADICKMTRTMNTYTNASLFSAAKMLSAVGWISMVCLNMFELRLR